MNSWVSFLVLLVCISTSLAKLDYSPCKISGSGALTCEDPQAKAADVLDAFRRNSDNARIKSLYITDVEDMLDEHMQEILDIVTKAAFVKMESVTLVNLKMMQNLPQGFNKLPNLESVNIQHLDGIKSLAEGSLTLASENMKYIGVWGGQLEEILPAAIQNLNGNLDGVSMAFSYNHLTNLDEAFFKPLLSKVTRKIFLFGNPFPCDCNLAWLLRDNRDLLEQNFFQGECVHPNQTTTDFYLVDPATLQNC